MSSAPQTGTTFEIRASLARFASDLKKSEQMAVQSASRVAAQTNAIASSIPQNLNALERQRFAQTGAGAGASGAGQAASAAAAAAAASQVQKIGTLLRTAGKAALAVEASIAAISVGTAAWEGVTAAVSGSVTRQKKAYESIRETIGSIPVVGEAIVAIGQKIYDVTWGTVSGENAYVAAITKATEEVDKHTAALAKQAKAKIDFNKQFADFAQKQADDAAAVTQTEAQKFYADIEKRRAALKEFLAKPESKAHGGGLTAAAESERQKTEAGIQALIRARGAAGAEEDTRAAADANAAILRAAGEEAAAKLAEFNEGLRRDEVEAAKKGADELYNVQSTNDAKRAEFAAQQDREGTDQKMRNAQEQADFDLRINEQIADIKRQREEREREASRSADDLFFQANQTRLQTAGRGVEAEIQRIQKDLERVIEGKGRDTFGAPLEDERVIAAARDNAQAQIEALQASLQEKAKDVRPETVSLQGLFAKIQDAVATKSDQAEQKRDRAKGLELVTGILTELKKDKSTAPIPI